VKAQSENHQTERNENGQGQFTHEINQALDGASRPVGSGQGDAGYPATAPAVSIQFAFGEHTRPRVSRPAPSPAGTGRAPLTKKRGETARLVFREGACAPHSNCTVTAQALHRAVLGPVNAVLLLAAAGCQSLSYTGPNGEHFSRTSFGSNTALQSLAVEAGTNGVRRVELHGYTNDSTQALSAVTEAVVRAAMQAAKP
jgi:hypothetical protein